MYKLGSRSLNNLRDVDANLVKVVKRAIEITKQDFTVIEGTTIYLTIGLQYLLFRCCLLLIGEVIFPKPLMFLSSLVLVHLFGISVERTVGIILCYIPIL